MQSAGAGVGAYAWRLALICFQTHGLQHTSDTAKFPSQADLHLVLSSLCTLCDGLVWWYIS
jgi:hypothetical protein